MVDKTGTTYEEALVVQGNHLNHWMRVLRDDIYWDVKLYIMEYNRPAATPNDKHQVFRGQDIVQILLDWPTPGAGYPQRGEDLI